MCSASGSQVRLFGGGYSTYFTSSFCSGLKAKGIWSFCKHKHTVNTDVRPGVKSQVHSFFPPLGSHSSCGLRLFDR